MTVINLFEEKAARSPHLSGKARCLACKRAARGTVQRELFS
jgi:hypothetical protein